VSKRAVAAVTCDAPCFDCFGFRRVQGHLCRPLAGREYGDVMTNVLRWGKGMRGGKMAGPP
jgi:hypothetical protein